MAQAPTPPKNTTPAHPGYMPNLNTPITLQITLPAGAANSYLLVQGYGGEQGILNSKMESGQAQQTLKEYRITLDSLTTASSRALMAWDKAQKIKFTADTIKLYQPKPVIKK